MDGSIYSTKQFETTAQTYKSGQNKTKQKQEQFPDDQLKETENLISIYEIYNTLVQPLMSIRKSKLSRKQNTIIKDMKT